MNLLTGPRGINAEDPPRFRDALTSKLSPDDKVVSRMGGEHPIVVTRHAQKRWRERVRRGRPCSNAQAKTAILAHAPAILKAALFGASLVKLSSGHRIVLDGLTVKTIPPPRRKEKIAAHA